MIQLVNTTSNPLRTLWYAVRQCTAYKPERYSSMDIEEVKRIVKEAIASGHDSILEHVHFSFRIDDISRNCSHQLVRHRMASYAQVSQRYVNQSQASVVVPYGIKVDPDLKAKWDDLMKASKEYYDLCVKNGIPKEDARFALPEATTTAIMVTMNCRELIHFFKLRCCFRAQWEIRNVAYGMLNICKEKLPVIFENVGPKCIMNNGCIESKKCKHYDKELNHCIVPPNLGMKRAMFYNDKPVSKEPKLNINDYAGGILPVYQSNLELNTPARTIYDNNDIYY